MGFLAATPHGAARRLALFGRNCPWFHRVVSNQFTAGSPTPTCRSSEPDGGLGGRTLEDYIRTAGGRALCPATTSAAGVVSATLSASRNAARRPRSRSIRQVQKDLQTGRDASRPAVRSAPT
jgi:hypothetical protein